MVLRVVGDTSPLGGTTMPVFKLESTVIHDHIVDQIYVESLIKDAGNKQFEVFHDINLNTMVRCDKKPLESKLLGIYWAEQVNK